MAQQTFHAKVTTDDDHKVLRNMKLVVKGILPIETRKVQWGVKEIKKSAGTNLNTDQKQNGVVEQLKMEKRLKRNTENDTTDSLRWKREAMKIIRMDNDEDNNGQFIRSNTKGVMQVSPPIYPNKMTITHDNSVKIADLVSKETRFRREFKKIESHNEEKENCDIDQHSAQKVVAIQSSANKKNTANFHKHLNIVNSISDQLVKSVDDSRKSHINDDKYLAKRHTDMESMKIVKAVPKKSVVLEESEKKGIPLAKFNENEKITATSFNQYGSITRSKRQPSVQSFASDTTTENNESNVQKREITGETTTEDVSTR